ncbi:MAG: hypothetical protein WA931_14890 [Rhodococcus sp. (in: high G+C Gram-positive bacteria)]
MSAILDPIRSSVPAAWRERVYVVVSAVVPVLGALSIVDDNAASAWTAAATSFVTLFFAVLYSSSTVRTALYSFLGAAAAVAQIYGFTQGATWAQYAAIAVSVLGTSLAAAKTPTVVDGLVLATRVREY